MATGYTQASGGATLTAEDVDKNVITPLLADAVVLKAAEDAWKSVGRPGSALYRTKGVPLKLPRITNTPIPDPWRAENTAIAEVDMTVDSVVLLPSSLKSLKTLHRTSDELTRHAVARGGSLDVFGTELVNKIALTLDQAMLIGPGTGNTVQGLAFATDIQPMASVGALTIDDLHDAVGLAYGANAKPTSWFCNSRELTGLRKLRSTTGEYLLQEDAHDASSKRLLGLPVYITNMIPTDGGSGDDESTIILADMNQVAIACDEAMEVRILTERYADFGQIGIRVQARWDIKPRNPAGVVVLQGVQPVTPWTPPA